MNNKIKIILITLSIILLITFLIGFSYYINLNFKSLEEQIRYIEVQTKANGFLVGHSRCLELSLAYLESHKNLTFVLGEIRGSSGSRMNHAWLEDGSKVFDPLFKLSYEKNFYYRIFNATISQKLTYQEVMDKGTGGKVFLLPE